MARKASLHIKPTMSMAQVLLHYARVFGLSYAVNKDHSVNDTKLYKTKKELLGLLKKIRIDYQKHSYRGRGLPSNATPIREGVVNLLPHHTLENVEEMAKKVAKKMGVEILAISVHRDEGKDAENLNYHAHILFNYFNFNTHKTVHHFAKDKIMPQVQDIVAEMLDMERGTPSDRKHIDHNQYREVAQLIEKEVDKATAPHIKKVGELKKEMEKLRKQMIETNKSLGESEKLYSKDDYKALAKLKKELNKNNFKEVVQSYYKLHQGYTQMKELWIKEKEENDKLRARADERDRSVENRTRERARSYEQAIIELDSTTESISHTTNGDFGRATEAYRAKQRTAGDLEFAQRVANGLNQFYRKIQEVISELAPKVITRKEALNFEITPDGVKKIRIYRRLKELNAKIESLEKKEIPKKTIPTLDEALDTVSEYSDMAKDRVYRVVNHALNFERPSSEWTGSKERYKQGQKQSKLQNKGINK